MIWVGLPLVALGFSLALNACLIYLLRIKHTAEDPLIEELRNSGEILREENKALHDRIVQMAASTPHIRLVKDDEEEIEARSTMEIHDDDGNVIGHKGAGVA